MGFFEDSLPGIGIGLLGAGLIGAVASIFKDDKEPVQTTNTSGTYYANAGNYVPYGNMQGSYPANGGFVPYSPQVSYSGNYGMNSGSNTRSGFYGGQGSYPSHPYTNQQYQYQSYPAQSYQSQPFNQGYQSYNSGSYNSAGAYFESESRRLEREIEELDKAIEKYNVEETQDFTKDFFNIDNGISTSAELENVSSDITEVSMENKVIFCSNCGTKIDNPIAKFCFCCGSKLER